MTEITLLLVAMAALLAFTNWRWGLFLCVLTGLLQDPLRKIIPNQPAYFVVLVGVVFGAAWLGALLARVRLGPNALEGWRRNMGLPFGLFLILVVLQAFQLLQLGAALRAQGQVCAAADIAAIQVALGQAVADQMQFILFQKQNLLTDICCKKKDYKMVTK